MRAGLVGAGQQDRELVAAQARNGIRRAQIRAQTRADLTQQVVADVVTEGVVDRLEVGEVHDQHRDGFAGAWLAQELLLQAFDEERAVRQAGQQIVEQLVLALLAQLEQLAYRARHDERGHQVQRDRESDALELDVVAVVACRQPTITRYATVRIAVEERAPSRPKRNAEPMMMSTPTAHETHCGSAAKTQIAYTTTDVSTTKLKRAMRS